MKVRVLYPTALPGNDEGGAEITVEDDDQAKAWIAAGFVEAVEAPKKSTARKAGDK